MIEKFHTLLDPGRICHNDLPPPSFNRWPLAGFADARISTGKGKEDYSRRHRLPRDTESQTVLILPRDAPRVKEILKSVR
jgi:hypothetical protein